MGLAAAAALGLLFAATEGMLPSSNSREPTPAPGDMVSNHGPSTRTANPVSASNEPQPATNARWSTTLSGRKLAVPLDAESQGKLDGVAVVVDGAMMHVDSYTVDGKLRWSTATDIGANQSLSPRRLAPVDYDGDGLFNELLVEISGTAFRPAPFPFGSDSEAIVFNFAILDAHGLVVWFHQCGHVTRGSIGTSFNSPGCTAQEAASIYREKLEQHGYGHGGRLVDEGFLRVDVSGDGSFGGAIQITENGVQVR